MQKISIAMFTKFFFSGLTFQTFFIHLLQRPIKPWAESNTQVQ